jgi:hypothetical protein
VKFRKKPIVIEAHMIGNDGWPDSIWQGVNSGAITLHLERRPPRGVVGHVEIRTLEGTMRGEVGDWIVRGVAGEFYPCKPDIFAETYEPADTPAQPSQPQQAGVTDAIVRAEGIKEGLLNAARLIRCDCCDFCGESPDYEAPCANVLAERIELLAAGKPCSLADARAALSARQGEGE